MDLADAVIVDVIDILDGFVNVIAIIDFDFVRNEVLHREKSVDSFTSEGNWFVGDIVEIVKEIFVRAGQIASYHDVVIIHDHYVVNRVTNKALHMNIYLNCHFNYTIYLNEIYLIVTYCVSTSFRIVGYSMKSVYFSHYGDYIQVSVYVFRSFVVSIYLKDFNGRFGDR